MTDETQSRTPPQRLDYQRRRQWVINLLRRLKQRRGGLLIAAIILALVGILAAVYARSSGWSAWVSGIAFILAGLGAGGALLITMRVLGKESAEDGIELSQDEKRAERDAKRARILVLWCLLCGTAALVLYSLGQTAPSGRARFLLFAVLALEGAAGFAFGALAGFLFGIPRSLRGQQPEPKPQPPAQTNPTPNPTAAPGSATPSTALQPATASSGADYASNTNLEEISDWLTKIIVGFGLINLREIPGKLRGLAAYFSSLWSCGPGCVPIPDSVSLAILIYFSVCGFFLAYLLTRLILPAAFRRAESSAAEKELVQAKQAKVQVKEALSDAGALSGQVKDALQQARESVSIAVEARQRVNELLAKPSFPFTVQARALINKGSESDLTYALSLLDEAIASDPKAFIAYLEKGRALRRLAKLKNEDTQLLQQALEAATRSRELAPPDYYPAFYNMACYKALLGMPVAEVAADLKRAIEINPKLKAGVPQDDDLKSVLDKPEIQALLS